MKSHFQHIMNGFMIIGVMIHVSFSHGIVYASPIEKVLSINIHDFYFNQEVDSKFTTGSTMGTDVIGNTISTCNIPVSGKLGHVLNDVAGGFRINDSTLNLTFDFGLFYLVGISGEVYTSSTGRRLRVNGTNIGDPIFSTITNVPQSFQRINLLNPLRGEVAIQASASIGLTEMMLYYTETDPSLSPSSHQQSSLSSLISTDETLYTYEGYYASLQGVKDAEIKATLTTRLRSILNVNNLLPTNITYGNARYDIPLFDADPSQASNVLLVYSQLSVNGTWDNGVTWNREHVFPQSLMGVTTVNSDRHKGADYHNLKPESPSVNSSRGNKYFAETTTTTSYAPPESVRGDVARILFYMVTMWPELSLVDITSGDPQLYQMAQLSLLVKWHHEDPVDSFEVNRNNIIYGLQGNRNPYIDHDELVCRVWQNTNVQTQSYCTA
jgi:endonuclease I